MRASLRSRGPDDTRDAVAGQTGIRTRFRRAKNELTSGPGRRTTVYLVVAGPGIGEAAHAVEMAVVSGNLPDQVHDDVPQRERLAGISYVATDFCVPVTGSNDVVRMGCLGGVLVQLGQRSFEPAAHLA